MFSVAFSLGNLTVPFVLLFKGEDEARAVIQTFETMGPQQGVWLKDDFGQELFAQRPVHGILFQDMLQAREADIIRGVFQAVTQAKAVDRAKTEPILQAHNRQQAQSPAVFNHVGQPMGRN